MAIESPDVLRRNKSIAKDLITGVTWFVNTGGASGNDGRGWNSSYALPSTAHTAATAGDCIMIGAADYDETFTVTKDNLLIIGCGGGRSSCSIAPSTANANAVVIDGTTASGRVEEVTLVNINGDANGTGIGLYAKGNIRRLTSIDCKWEAGDTTGTGVRLESTAAGSVGDVRISGGEICWAQTGLSITASGGGDPVTEVYVEDVRFHNITANHVLGATVSAPTVELYRCRFEPLEAGTAPTGLYVDLRVAGSTGGVYDCLFPVAVTGSKVLVAAGITVMSRFTGGLNTAAPT